MTPFTIAYEDEHLLVVDKGPGVVVHPARGHREDTLSQLLALLVYFIRHRGEPLIWLPTGMLFGGALGNLIDRARAGSVTDFIKLPLGWPPFNLADAAITLGIVILFGVIENARRAET